MGRFEHGGDVYAHPGVVDFSANVNPLGMPAAAKRELARRVDDFQRYPDPAARELTRAIAAHEGVPVPSILVTAGASDLMARVCLAVRPRVALVTAPCYSGYEQALGWVGARVERVALRGEEGFRPTDRLVSAFHTGLDLAFIASPNNPTGITVPRGLLVRMLDRAAGVGCVVVVDECFLDFTDAPSAASLTAAYANLVVMKAFTKTYAMAGLRLGYGICSDAELVARLVGVGQPWAVSVPAQVAGLAALGETDYLPRTRAYVAKERERLRAGLAALGLQVVPGEANYLLFCSPVPLYQPLLDRGMLIRRCQNYEGLGEGWYRVAVRTRKENEALLGAVAEVL